MSRTQLFDLDGKIAFVSGASRGIGEAIARLLAQQGAHVIVSSRKLEGCQPVADAIIAEGGKVYACRFALQALYGHGEGALIEGIRPINPLDVLDVVLLHKKAGAVILDTWTL